MKYCGNKGSSEAMDMIDKLQDKLEEIKQMGNYSVSLNYGEDVGCDDSSVPQLERRIMVIFYPVGCLGETKIMYKGALSDFLAFNLKTRPKTINNPPKREEYEDGGYFIWGTEKSVAGILDKPFHGGWE